MKRQTARDRTSKHTYCAVPNLRQHWLEVKRIPLKHRKTMLVTARLTWMLAIWRVYPKCRQMAFLNFIYSFLLYAFECLAALMFVHHMHAVPSEASRGQRSLLDPELLVM